MSEDIVNHPKHYEACARDGYQPIDLIEHYPFALGSAMKYLFRAGKKEGNSTELDLRKARWYLRRAAGQKSGWQSFGPSGKGATERAKAAKLALVESTPGVNPYLKMLFMESRDTASVTVRSIWTVLRVLDAVLGKEEDK